MKMNRAGQQNTIPTSLLLIDGHCNLCHTLTQFVIKRDVKQRFHFASLQSNLGQRLLQDGGLCTDELDTFVLIENQQFYIKSTAALRMFRGLGGLWPLLYALMIVPVRVRDWVYDFVAKRRYRWFGQTDACMLPTAELRSRFIDDDGEGPIP